ncbi:MAG: carbonic anhydrase [Chromatiales bacterium]
MSLEGLIAGYCRFRTTRFPSAQVLYRQLEARGQSPKTLLIACCDSRVDPATIFDAGPGELFVVRNVANLVPPSTPDGRHHGTSAALEFAVLHLQVECIVVMGHAQCGGAKALLEGVHEDPSRSDFIGSWMGLAAPARERVLSLPVAPADMQRRIEYEIVRESLTNLLSFQWLRQRVEKGSLALHGLHFGIATGELAMLDAKTGEFRPVPVGQPDLA